MDKKAQNEKEPLTLDGLVEYSQKVLLPAIEQSMDKRFEKVATKEEVARMNAELKQEIAHVRGAVLTALDENTNLLRKISQEQDAAYTTVIRHDEEIKVHDKKIARLQEKVGV